MKKEVESVSGHAECQDGLWTECTRSERQLRESPLRSYSPARAAVEVLYLRKPIGELLNGSRKAYEEVSRQIGRKD